MRETNIKKKQFSIVSMFFLSFIYLLQITVVKSHNNRLWMYNINFFDSMLLCNIDMKNKYV